MALNPALPDPLAGNAYPPKEVTTAATSAGKQAHINGFKSELRLANKIAEHSADIVVQYGNPAGINGADVVSINRATGEATLWDSKYRGAEGSFDSETFTKDSPRKEAVERALSSLNSGNHKLPPAIATIAKQNLQKERLTAITLHTGGGDFKNKARRHTGKNYVEDSPP